jgi:hypothetical protein
MGQMNSDNDMAALDSMINSLAADAPPQKDESTALLVKKPEWGVQDKDGATMMTEDPIAGCTPEPTPAPHPPPAANTKLFEGALVLPTIPGTPVVPNFSPPTPVEQSALTSRVIEAPPTPIPPLEKVKEDKIFLTGNSGVGKSFIAALLRRLKPHILVVDGIDSARDFKALQAAGFINYHVICTGATLESRARRQNIQEPLAQTLNQSVKLALLKGGSNVPLHVIWNDPMRKPPSPRLLTVDEFLDRLI